jgi:hypothetical protein
MRLLLSPVLLMSNSSTRQVLFNPGAFVEVIKCACTDTFQATYPQCADWFVPFFCVCVLSSQALIIKPLFVHGLQL